MKSISYRIGSFLWGKKAVPRNIDDCIDHSSKSTPKKISLNLVIEEFQSDTKFIQLSADYTWVFEDKQAEYNTFYGILFPEENEHKKKEAIDTANALLQEDLKKIENARIPVAGEEQRFSYFLKHTNNCRYII